MQTHANKGFAENKDLTFCFDYDRMYYNGKKGDTPMVNKTTRKPMATAWIDNQHRLVFDIREIRRGRNKGKLECYYRKGKGFRQTIILKSDIKETLPCP